MVMNIHRGHSLFKVSYGLVYVAPPTLAKVVVDHEQKGEMHHGCHASNSDVSLKQEFRCILCKTCRPKERTSKCF